MQKSTIIKGIIWSLALVLLGSIDTDHSSDTAIAVIYTFFVITSVILIIDVRKNRNLLT